MFTLPISGRHPVPRFDFGVPADAGIHGMPKPRRLATRKSRPLANQPVALKRLADLQAA
jgi:hypothetical protein